MKRSVIVMLAVLLCLSGCTACTETAERSVFCMDTYCTIEVHGKGAETAADAAVAELNRLDKLFSISESGSDVNRINESEADAVSISEDTAELIRKSRLVNTETDGAFDLTIEPVVRLWGFYGDTQHVPDADELREALKRVDDTQLSLSGDTLWRAAGQRVDFGAVAKGYAAARMAEILSAHGAEGAWISLGGNVQTLGTRSGGGPWRIGVRDPLDEASVIGVVTAGDCAIVTAGAYQRYFEDAGKTYHHIIDPDTGCPADSGLLSATVIAKDGTRADALSTALFVMGREAAEEFWRKTDDFDMILVSDAREVFYTGEAYTPEGETYRQVQIVE